MYDMSPYLKKINEVIEKGPYSNNWHSLSEYEVPEWYRKAKFGIFIHWGVFSVPAFGNEWYSRNMYVKDSPEYKHHIDTYGKHTDFGYKDFIPMFKAEKFDPMNGQSFSELREQSMLFPLQSITTDFRCTGAKSHTGTLTKWGLTVTFSEN